MRGLTSCQWRTPISLRLPLPLSLVLAIHPSTCRGGGIFASFVKQFVIIISQIIYLLQFNFLQWQRQFTFGNERSEITLVIGFDLLPLFYQVPYLYSTGFFIHPLLLYFTDGKERTQGFMNCCAALDFFLSHPVCST